jgi:transglutaminase-like putative cysteine protease
MPHQQSPTSSTSVGRRAFLLAGLALPLAGARISAQFQRPDVRTFEVRVELDLGEGRGEVRAWIPLALDRPTAYQRLVAQRWTASTEDLRRHADANAPSMLVASWPYGSARRTLTLTTRIETTRYHVTLEPNLAPLESAGTLAKYLAPTTLIPTDGIVRATALGIVKGHTTPLAKARAIYDWIVDNTFRDPAVKGCGLGDIRWMLESRSFGGKCADLNALFVGLCRSVGLPARDLYGLRLGESRSFTSLGRTGDITAAQHCRAEVYVAGIGWVPVDPADVRKVALEEEPGAPMTSAHVRRARAEMFGTWEMNWMAFNDAHDVTLPGSSGKPLPYLMYPQAEVAGARRDSLEPRAFIYRILVEEVS